MYVHWEAVLMSGSTVDVPARKIGGIAMVGTNTFRMNVYST